MKLKRKVELVQIDKEPFQASFETIGHLEAEGQTEIASGVNGLVDEVLFREGQWVDRDTILVLVDQKRFLSALDGARAQEKKAEAALALSRELEGLTRLAGAGSSGEDRVRAAGNSRLAGAELANARSARELAEHNLFRSQVRAPYAGQINQRKVTAGSFLEDRTVIANMANLSRLRLAGYLPEKSAPVLRQVLDQEHRIYSAMVVSSALISPLQGVLTGVLWENGLLPIGYNMEFTLRAVPGEKFKARLFYISSVASPDTHMFECKGMITAVPDMWRLRPGYTAKMTCALPGKSEALVVPEEAVRAGEKGFVLFQPMPRQRSDGVVEWVAKPRVLQLGMRRPGVVEVLEGVREKDWIVRRGADALEDGTPLDITPEMEKALLKSVEAAKAGSGGPANP